MARTYTKWPYNIRNILQNIPTCFTARPSKIYQHVSLQGPPKYTQIVISGLKIYHLATLVRNVNDGLKSRHFSTFWTSTLQRSAPPLFQNFLPTFRFTKMKKINCNLQSTLTSSLGSTYIPFWGVLFWVKLNRRMHSSPPPFLHRTEKV
jgi:hypothetical protein